jgi:hypothetical protein
MWSQEDGTPRRGNEGVRDTGSGLGDWAGTRAPIRDVAAERGREYGTRLRTRKAVRRAPRPAPAVKAYAGPPMTLGNAASAHVRLIVWCKSCGRRTEPEAAEMAKRYGLKTSVIDWSKRLVCSRCRSRNTDMVVTGTERP